MEFQEKKQDLTYKRGIYIYGNPGTGKTEFIIRLLKDLNYDVVKYDAGDIRNKCGIETITKHNISDKNIVSIFQKKVRKIVILMDEIDGMNSGDKGGINLLIKLIRPKKTKKQRTEEVTMNPIICIGNYHIDKKIKELMKVCNTYELKTPTPQQVNALIDLTMPTFDAGLKPNVVSFIQGDLRKLGSIYHMHKTQQDILQTNVLHAIFQPKTYNEDSKKITQKLINKDYTLTEHMSLINETDRTIVGLLWHENIIDVLGRFDKRVSIPFYQHILDNVCFADYIDRIRFQKQIWLFNEMSSLIKTFYNNHLYHETFKKKPRFNPTEVRFTKVLTKYSTEYNNTVFIQKLCQQLSMDQKDMFTFFYNMQTQYDEEAINSIMENYEISRLDINRIYRYLDKYLKVNAVDSEASGGAAGMASLGGGGGDDDGGGGLSSDDDE